ncbi:MAG TPA: hypothetical protein VMU17_02030 [Elusimicrobiota bacterium]|nr:hypothetical protein [Elusimicrobiota bacterium]
MSAGHQPRGWLRFWAYHSLSLTVLAVTVVWVLLYWRSDPSTHWGSFYGNAIADWLGAYVIIVVTKYLHERGSTESRPFKDRAKTPFMKFLAEHSLSLFLLAALAGLVIVYSGMDPAGKWGSVVGNTVSQFVQLLGLVLFTKKLFEKGSRETDARRPPRAE